MFGKPAQHSPTSANKLSLLMDVSEVRYLVGIFDEAARMARIAGESFAFDRREAVTKIVHVPAP